MVVIERQLAHVAGEGRREFRRRVHVAEEDVGNGATAFGAGAPDIQDGVHFSVFPGKRQRTAGHKDHHDRLSRGFQGLQKLFLGIGNGDIRSRGAFAVQGLDFAHTGDDHIGLPGLGDGLGDEPLLRYGMDVRGLVARHEDLVQAVSDGFFQFLVLEEPTAFSTGYPGHFGDALKRGDALVIVGGHGPGTRHGGGILGQWTDYGDAQVLGQRQDAVVLEEHHGFLRSLAGESEVLRGIDFFH